ncbi:MAG: type II toxin-antitoxin system VapC family toxin [Gammaproteobacteria bacterium]|nr:type II toxin-antitoxin system VapC family toxin [Gammaproteobacteria bacterium]
MIGLDSNVLVRYLVQDEPDQAARATQLIEQELSAVNPGFIGLIVLVETCWVLRRLYRVTSAELLQVVADLLDTQQLVVENRPAVLQALDDSRTRRCTLVDALVARCATAAGCSRVVTFDRGARSAGMTLLDGGSA